MRTLAKAIFALGFIAAAGAIGTAPAEAFYLNGPGFHVWVGDHHRDWGPRYGYYGAGNYNGCPPHWTVQGGACKPYNFGPWDYY